MAVTRKVAADGRYTVVSSWVSRRLSPYLLFPVLGLLALFLVYPIFMVVYGSFKGGPPGTDAPFSVDGYVRAWTNWPTYKALIVTFALAVPRVATGVGLAIVIAWAITRTNTPLRGLFEQLLWLKLFLPTLPILIAWLFIAAGRTGLVNQFLMNVFDLSRPPLDIRSYWGVIFLSLVSTTPIFFMYMSPAFRNMDASLEESSRVSGASSMATLFRITVPVLMPAILGITLLLFLFVLGSYETELFLLSGRGVYVFSTFIWWNLGREPPDYPSAMALANVFVLFTTAVVILQFKILGGRQFVTVTGRGFGARVLDLGKWRWLTFGLLVSWFLVALVLPLSLLVLGTFQKTYGMFETGYTLRWWREAFEGAALWRSLKNTLLLGFMAATAGTILYFLMSYAYLRTRLKGRQWVEIVSWVPRMAPGLVAGIGVLWAILGGIPGLKFLYGTLFLMAIVIMMERTPQGMRLMNGGMVQLSAELEEASRLAGGSWFRTMRRVMVPLLAPTLLNEWVLAFLSATRNLVLLLFLYLPQSKTLSLEIFEKMMRAEEQAGAVLGVVLTAITLVVAILARFIAMRQRRVLEATA